ncbi:Glycoside-hydrolase family GH114, TIM-barrel domain containing protein [Flavobacteriaceae bacterium]
MRFLNHALLFIILFVSCSKDEKSEPDSVSNAKQKMRDFVIEISQYAKAKNSNFNIIPQNGIELVSNDGESTTVSNNAYLNAIDANGQEDLLYGYDNDDQATPVTTTLYLKDFLNLSKNTNKKILVIDYCSTVSKMNSSYFENNKSGYVSFAADHRELNNIPTTSIYLENNAVITAMSQVKNFLYLINPEKYTTKTAFINAVTATNYDLVIMDLYFNDGTPFTKAEISALKNKANGGKRLVVSYMSIGEAENYRFYWQNSWNTSKPNWLDAENPDWKGNFKVKFWDTEWKKVIYGDDNSYVKRILDAGFDGTYLDIIDAFEYYEN